ncbi:hypothetical protein [Coleofasciculus sp.]|uniref:hypothetical protein n=1 Tax=Coleofasciculus sp. TaxID=3100458 RepID=UPI003A3F37D2
MVNDPSVEIVPSQVETPISVDLTTSIEGFNVPLANYLVGLGLPTENVLYPIAERSNVLNALKDALGLLPIDQRAKATYLTKFAVAIAVGLFDGALNYLWNETISALKRLVSRFDLQYLFSVAEKISSRYKNLSNEEDLNELTDHDLLEACRRIGLLSDVNYKRLETVNYMRNHASAAHPNENEIDGFEMLSWLRNCLRHAIVASPDHSVISVKQLLDNIRNTSIPGSDFKAIGEEISRLPQERIDDFMWTLFGMYTDPKQTAITKANIEAIASYVWNASSQDRKFEIGTKFGIFRKNGEVARKEATEKFLRIVNGLSYKDEDSLAGELIDKLETLKSVHFARDNFYNEYPHARSLKDSIPANGIIPRAARPLWVKVICLGYVGNGKGYREGVDEKAVIYYKEHINKFTEVEVITFLRLMRDPEFILDLGREKSDKRLRDLAKVFKEKSSNIHIQRVLDWIISFPLKLDSVGKSIEFEKTMKYVPEAK